MTRIATQTRDDSLVDSIDTKHAEFWNPAWFLPHLAIRPKLGGTVPFKLRSHQVKLAVAVQKCVAEGRWLVHLKARQEGATTFCAGVVMQHVMFREGITAGLIGNKGADKKNSGIKNMVEMCKRFWRSIPARQRPAMPAGLVNSLEFPDLDSSVVVEAARADDPFRGSTLQIMLADEIASWDNADDTWAAALNAVPDEGALVMALSTPHHYGDAMHTVCQGAQRPGSKWLYVFTPWTQLAEYSLQAPRGWRPSPDVLQYATRYRLTEGQAYWMESVGLPKCNYKHEKFLAEYPPDDVSCWVRTGGEMFAAERLMEMLVEAQARAATRGPAEDIEVYHLPKPGHSYIVAADPASDDARRDQWGLVVLDATDCTVAVTFQGYSEHHRMARRIDEMSLRYNGARIYPERNGVGEAVISHLKLRPDIFSRLHGEAPRAEDSEAPVKWGWTSTTGSKVTALSDLQEIIRDGTLDILCERLIKQLLGYRGAWERGRDSSGGHYDLVAAMSIAAWAYRHDRAKLRCVDLRGATVEEGWQTGPIAQGNWSAVMAEVSAQQRRGDWGEEGEGYRTRAGLHR